MKPTAELKARHILVVDDNEEWVSVCKRLLERHGYTVTTAPDGAFALRTIRDSDVDVIVSDLQMPRLEGDMFFATVQQMNPELCHRFLFITGMGADPSFQPFINQFKAPVLFKPVDSAVLIGEIERVAQSNASPA